MPHVISKLNFDESNPYPSVDAEGNTIWYKNKKIHRDDGPAIEWANGDKDWYKNGKIHREDGPAVEYANGSKEWLQNGVLHRDNGPAREGIDGFKEWWWHGKQCTLEEHCKLFFASRGIHDPEPKSIAPKPIVTTPIKTTRSILSLDD